MTVVGGAVVGGVVVGETVVVDGTVLGGGGGDGSFALEQAANPSPKTRAARTRRITSAHFDERYVSMAAAGFPLC